MNKAIKLLLLPVLAITMLNGCSLFQRNVTVDVVPEKIPFIHPSSPNKMFIKEVKWTVLNEERLRELLNSIEPGEKIALFVLTAQGYEALAENMAEVTRYIKDQKAVIVYYYNATEIEDEPQQED